MKVRSGFVSNSSSSSFVCSVCNNSYEGWDGMYDTAHYYCRNRHEICGHCSTTVKLAAKSLAADLDKAIEQLGLDNAEANELMGARDKETWIREYTMEDYLSPAVCPLCNLTHIPGSLEAQYLREKFDQKREDVLTEIRDKFGSLEGWEKRNEG